MADDNQRSEWAASNQSASERCAQAHSMNGGMARCHSNKHDFPWRCTIRRELDCAACQLESAARVVMEDLGFGKRVLLPPRGCDAGWCVVSNGNQKVTYRYSGASGGQWRRFVLKVAREATVRHEEDMAEQTHTLRRLCMLATGTVGAQRIPFSSSVFRVRRSDTEVSLAAVLQLPIDGTDEFTLGFTPRHHRTGGMARSYKQMLQLLTLENNKRAAARSAEDAYGWMSLLERNRMYLFDPQYMRDRDCKLCAPMSAIQS